MSTCQFWSKQGRNTKGFPRQLHNRPNDGWWLLETLAPIVMGALGKQQQENGLNPSDLPNLLNNQQQEAQAHAPDAMSMLGAMLDQNKDGSAMDDLQCMAANFFK